MKTIIVSLISDQNIPNLEFIKEHPADAYLFVTTKEKTSNLKWLIHAAKIDEAKILPYVLVNAFSFEDVELQLNAVINDEDRYLVNLTGGTKIMSLATREVFKNVQSEMYYLTGMNKESIKLFPGRNKPSSTNNTKISLEEYLNAYGFNVISKGTMVKSNEQTKKVLAFYTNAIQKEDFIILEDLRVNYRGKKLSDFSKVEGLGGVLEKMKFEPQTAGVVTKEEVKYLTGEWLEEFMLDYLKQEKGLLDNEIGMGWQLHKDNGEVNAIPNEFDILFVKNNQLQIIECKSSIFTNIEETKNLIAETIYKADSLRNKLGLFANTAIITVSDLNTPKLKIPLERADASRVKVKGKQDFIEGTVLNFIR
jgi:hypothetical protein